MIWTIFLIAIISWGLGMTTSNTMGGFIHVFLGIAITVLFLRVIPARSETR